MDPRWLPWCWAAGAVGCAAVFLTVQPWRAEWLGGFRLVRKYPASWALPGLLLGLDAAMAWLVGQTPVAAEELPSWAVVGQGIAETLQGLQFGPGAALAGIVLLASNAWGMRRGFLKGVSSVTGRPGFGALSVLLLGAVALGADVALTGYGVPAVWHAVVTALAIPLVGWVAAIVLAGLLLLAETESRAPGKVAEVRWLESAAAHSVRLWPWALGHGLAWWLGRGLPEWAAGYVRGLLALGAVALAFAPLVFLHVKQVAGAREGGRHAMELWRRQGWQPLAWLAVAGLIFYLAWLAGQEIHHALPDPAPALRIGLACLMGLVHVGIPVLGLGAWVEFRLAGGPPPKRQRSPRS